MKNSKANYLIVLYVTEEESDKVVFDKVNENFTHCRTCSSLKELCMLLVETSTPKILLMTGDSLENSLINYYRCLDAVSNRKTCQHRVVSLIPRKFEREAFEAHRCLAIDDYLVSRPIFELHRIVLICEHLLIELGIAANKGIQNKVTSALKNLVNDKYAALIEKALNKKALMQQEFENTISEIESSLDDAAAKIQKHQSVKLDIEKLRETLSSIKSDEIRPELLMLQQKTISLLEKAIDQDDTNKDEEQADTQTPEFNRLYKQDVDVEKLLSRDGKPKVLLVEDDLISQQLTLRLLHAYEIDVEVAKNGRVALANISTCKYDLILMDINLPDTNGIYIVSQTQNHANINHNTPVIMLTGMKQKSTVKEALERGAKGYVVKPITKSTISKILTKFALIDN
ncbi:response regulator [Glaciecola sp. MH2013]|uniref:response regulator n=1 Tax=Glaciecola sp. MH2013 TaxID=2785524 RepID=UPI0018A0B387|nr:response regulator [Glaciecola sp. MH2013]MBF7073332.1 response regulator [Glaciecola sp. MH2013]